MNLLDCLTHSLPLFLVCIGILSLTVGSFLNVVVARLPHTYSHNANPATPALWHPRSQCPNCQHPIQALDNIPLLSFFWLRGHCRHCRSPISIQYPLTELLTSLLSLLVAIHFGVSIQTGFALTLLWALIALSFIDFKHFILPDSITLPFMGFGILINFFDVFCSLQDSMLGSLLGYSTLWLVYKTHKAITGKEGMGYGDFKLLAMLGAWLGWQDIPLIILFSSAIGSCAGLGLILFQKQDRHTPIPFGPYLALAGFIALLWDKTLINRYLEILQ